MDNYISKLSNNHMTKSEELTASKDELIEANMKFVVNVAHKYKGNGLELEDLIQAGNHGLIMATEKFDKKKDIKFITFAVYYIKLYIREALTSHNNKIKRCRGNGHKLSELTEKQVLEIRKLLPKHTNKELGKKCAISKKINKIIWYITAIILAISFFFKYILILLL